MKFRLLILTLFMSLSVSAQINDTAILRGYINANIVPNSTRAITATQLNNSLIGIMNTRARYNIDSIWINTTGDTIFYLKAGAKRFYKLSYPIDTVYTIGDMISYNGQASSLFVEDSLQGGYFKLTNSALAGPVDSGIVFPATGKGGGKKWVRPWDRAVINANWFGVLPGIADASRGLNRAIEYHAPVSIMIPPGTYRLKNIIIPSGVTIWANQDARNNVSAPVAVKILPAAGADIIFDFKETSQNAQLIGLYIDGDFTNNPNLFAAVRVRGTFNEVLKYNNIINCPNHGIWLLAGAVHIEFNNVQGNAAHNLPFSSPEDFHGAVHIVATGDSYIQNNEFGANAPYLAGQVPDPAQIIRDPTYKRVVTLYGGYLGNSYVENNLIENGDQGMVLNGCFVGHFKGNRYEMNAFRGVRLRNVYNTTFDNEHYTNNSLALNGQGEDLRLDTGAVAFCTFTSNTFVRAAHPAIPTSYYKVKFNIVNYSGAGGNTIVTPSFADTSAAARYDSLGHYDNTIAANSLRIVEGQYDPKNVAYNSVIAGGDGNKDPYTAWVNLGGVKLSPGTTTGGGGYTGSISWFKPGGTTVSSVGLNNTDDLTFTLFNPGGLGRYILTGGEMLLTKNGASGITITSADGLGDPHFNFTSGTKFAGSTLNHTTGDLSSIASGTFSWTTGNGTAYTFLGGSMTVAKAGGLDLSVISDNTGLSNFRLSSDALGAHSFNIGFNNATGITAITGSSDITIGNNWKYDVNGFNYIPTTPSPAGGDTTYDFTVRNHSDGKLVIKSNVYWDSTRVKSYVAGNSPAAINNINGLTGPAISVVTGTSGTDFNIQSASNSITLNIPDASSSARGLVTALAQTFAGNKTSTGWIATSSLTCTNATANLYLPIGAGAQSITSTAQYLWGGAGTIYSRVFLGGGNTSTALSANSNFSSVLLGNNNITTAATGTHKYLANLTIYKPFFNSGGATVTNLANLLVLGSSSGATNNYNLMTDSGTVALNPTQGNVLVGGSTSGNIGIGQIAPLGPIHITRSPAFMVLESTSAYSSTSGSLIELMGSGVPSATNQRLGSLVYGAMPNSASLNPSAQIDAFSEGAWTAGTTQPTQLRFFTTPSGAAAVSQRMVIQANGNIGINQTSPTSTLHVTGSVSHSIAAVSANTTLDETYYTVRATTSGITLTFPAASSCPGRMYVIINYNSGGNITTSAFLTSGAVSTTTVATATTVCVQSDGTNWYKIN